jgi:hypothetical protein
MKMFLVLSLLVAQAFAQDTAPFQPEVYQRFTTNESTASTMRTDLDASRIGTSASAAAYAADGLGQKRVARATYNVATNLGTIGSHLLGVSLPAKAMITQAYFYVVTQFVDAGAGTVALTCEDAGNIFAAQDVTGIAAGGKATGTPTGSAANMVAAIGAACELTATVATAAQTAGKMIIFVEYVIVE